MGFLGVYKAIYDYVPQGESELQITEGDILYVLEKSTEDDWWKAKKKASGSDDDEPVGLIPSNYIEEAHPTHRARALYDYTRQTDEELSFTDGVNLEVFDDSDPDWILVGLNGEYGFAPANYIEAAGEGDASEPSPPSLPRRPAQMEEEPEADEPAQSPAPNPAAALAGVMNARRAAPQYTPEASDDDEAPTPALPTRPSLPQRAPELESYERKSPASPASPESPHRGIMASPPYSRVAHRGNDNDPRPGGFHMYNINEMVSVMGKRKKMPTTLGVNIGAGLILIVPEKSSQGPELTWTADKMTHYSIEGKRVFIELRQPSKSFDFHAGAKDTAQEIVAALGELGGAVRAGEIFEIGGSGGGLKTGQMLYEFMAQGDDEVTVAVGDEVIVLDDTKSEEWWQVRRVKNGKEGVVPSSYVEITGVIDAPKSHSGVNAGKSTVEQNREEEIWKSKEAMAVARREEESKGQEVGPGMKLPERGSSLMAPSNNNNNGQQRSRQSIGHDGQSKSSKSKPDSSKVRQWTDRSKSFSVEAQFLGLKDGKIHLHKLNGVKIAVPVVKMSVEDLEYVERVTGVSLDEDKPLSDIKGRRGRRDNHKEEPSSSGAGATIEKEPEYDWFQFFLSCDVAVGLCERYAQTFHRDSMDESVLPDVDPTVLRTLGIREGDIIKIIRFLDKKYGRSGGKRNVSFGEEDPESAGGLFSGPGGTLRNNTRKGRPAPAVQTSDIVDPRAFSQEPKSARSEALATSVSSQPTLPPIKKDPAANGFDDDAWDMKPSKQPQTQPTASQPTPAAPSITPAPTTSSQPALTGSMMDLNLLSQPLIPDKAQSPTLAAPSTVEPITQIQPQQTAQQLPPQVTPSFFQGIGQQQTGLPQQQQQQTGQAPQFQQSALPQNIARQRPAAPQQFSTQSPSLMIPAPPSRPLSAPQVNQNSGFFLPPLQSQTTGMPNPGLQQQIAPPGQSLDDMRLRQQFTNFNGGQNARNLGMMPQQTGFQSFPGMQQPAQQQQTGFQYPLQTGMQPQQPFINNAGSPFADPRASQFSPIQQQPTGFQSSFGPPTSQQFPQQTGVNSFLPTPLQPTPTGMQSQNNGYSSFNPPPVPPMPQQHTAMPLVPQQTGPPPPVRFGVHADAKKVMPQPTGRRANLSQATPQNPFGF
ncbi:actin cytoskeleton-regulatory complex protein sla1 [Calycina marina]|uniref:Actin cytoskeleton-regulatory complex protein SLA1 n=1 Tax=Calycina marina TaxID=1763456 RepID=A0A9P7YY13_9HELO|nr:actin cytoskeleton-regulatory complex protein sla1 [Calycina marina]